ncbi:ribonuclease P protein component 2 [archaeon]|nr:ribonuclease P protein component 2 [archaeon]
MTPYPPVLREKRRYISFKVHAKMLFTENQVKHSLNNSILDLLGERGVASSGFNIVEYNEQMMSGIARSTNEQLDNVIFALTLIKDVQGKNAWCQILGVSGTIESCQKKFPWTEKILEKPTKQKLAKKPAEIMKYAKN